MSQGGTILIPFTGGAEGGIKGAIVNVITDLRFRKRCSKRGRCLQGSVSLCEPGRMWRLSCCKPPCLVLRREADGTGGAVDRLEVGPGSPARGGPRAGSLGRCTGPAGSLTLPFPAAANRDFTEVPLLLRDGRSENL